ncbi:DUF3298 and DUF4163 domain-containing protein [Pseudomonas sp. PDM15]|uniref:DUF3298 and DUF4163 domain-containing protein n=1 Tax=Pseudomonas sp. PDM15 TaxID=2769303 RepID=UPI0021F09FFE|nr:DUF3298 and DUF4163 domain-containing protein [Pseudomonas sp. PDM15]
MSEGYKFEFDFPDFPGPAQRVVSKNIEAWGNELLVHFRSSSFLEDEAEADLVGGDVEALSRLPHRLTGGYRVVRNDSGVISLEYKLHYFYSGAAHGGIETRVQNFLVNPFRPITVIDLLADGKSIEDLAGLIRGKLRATGYYDEEWMMGGTKPTEENYSRFLICNYGIEFVFEEYQIASYADGRQSLFLDFYQLKEVCDVDLLDRLQDHDNYDW